MALSLLDGLWREGTPVRLVGVGLSDFGPQRPTQLSLFASDDERGADPSLRRLSSVADEVRRRFGDDALGYGRDLRLRGD